MKKMYIQPEILVTEYMSTTALCTSGSYGGSSENAGDDSQIIEVP